VGALNWGLIGAFRYNLVDTILGSWPMLERLVYVLVGISAIYLLFMHKADCKMCAKMGMKK